MRGLPSIDMHAHIESSISASDLDALDALVFAATRSLDEAEVAVRRTDPWTIWGAGCHPGLAGALKAFDRSRFESLIDRTALVSEVGLDGASRVSADRQSAVFAEVLSVLQQKPRICSIHSYAATADVLAALRKTPITGAVLHWWLGDEAETAEAVGLGCYFSVNATMIKKPDVLSAIPLERLLTETDHPFGDRSAGKSRRPGYLAGVERALSERSSVSEVELRRRVARNLASLVAETRTAALLPRAVRLALAAA